MSEMIERVARTISLWDGNDWDGAIGGRDCVRDRYRGMARAAIEEMLEPTDDMKRAGWHVLREKNDFQTRMGNSLVGTETPVFSAMIAAALPRT